MVAMLAAVHLISVTGTALFAATLCVRADGMSWVPHLLSMIARGIMARRAEVPHVLMQPNIRGER